MRALSKILRVLQFALLFLGLGVSGAAQGDDVAAFRPFEGHVVVRFERPSARQIQAISALGAMPWSCRINLAAPEFLLDPQQRDIVDRMGLTYRVLIDNVQAIVDAERAAMDAVRAAQRAAAGEQGGVAGAPTDPAEWFAVYRTWPEVNAYIDELVALRPDLVEKIEVGTTHEDRTIYGMRIAAPGGSPDRPVVLFNGCQHAREWISAMVPMYIADRLVRMHGDDDGITTLLEDIEFIIVPISNPDGYEYSYADEANRMWRKNRRFNGMIGDNEFYGVDLNRNWDADWNGGQFASEYPWAQTYVGPSVFSEPEVQGLRDLVLSEPRIAAHIDFHSYSQLILHPLGYTTEPAEDFDALVALGDMMSDAIASVHGADYAAGHGSDLLYLASGMFPDWMYESRGVFGYTIEVRPTSLNPGFLLPPEEILPTCEENFAAAMTMAQYVLDELVTCTGDLNGDGAVGVPDLIALLGAWGDCDAQESPCETDLSGDGTVGVPDLIMLLAAWGDCPR